MSQRARASARRSTQRAGVAAGAGLVAARAAHGALIQRRMGARESARVLYYRTHSFLRALRQHLAA